MGWKTAVRMDSITVKAYASLTAISGYILFHIALKLDLAFECIMFFRFPPLLHCACTLRLYSETKEKPFCFRTSSFFFLYFKLSFSQILYPYKIPLFPAFAVNLTLWPLSGHCPSQDMRIDVKNFNNLGTS